MATLRVNLVATMEDQSVHVEDSPGGNLLLAVEGERGFELAAKRVWPEYMRTHNDYDVQSIRMRLSPSLSVAHRDELLGWVRKLVRQILQL